MSYSVRVDVTNKETGESASIGYSSCYRLEAFTAVRRALAAAEVDIVQLMQEADRKDEDKPMPFQPVVV